MTYRVRILRRALADLAAIRDYIAQDAPNTAQRYVEGLLQTVEGLSLLPERGAIPHDARLRRLGFRFLTQGPYLIFYKVRGSNVRVYRVLHGRRAYADLL
ncbi:MAG: type II toxin-antitoxin system RelE/ParE family toxin [Planctomycetes bacterium]|nr:type II toxin-antitoxin system RelE/ParE family toxin [Planctomycetota bacterium]